jgi:FtsZ-binding cell division protein ZapB
MKNMNPFPYIEKWISEHGSAAVLRDHVALLKTQMEDLKLKVSGLEKEVSSLKTERDQLKSERDYLHNQAEIAEAAKQPFPQPGLIHDFDRKRRRVA